ncbi:hypothetical protein L3067_01240 [Xanthomonas sp. PPL568]|uniref:hypothetical protein n=1 Tax=Xanthomonas indica TaxID=2912242 RepID=UPI001F56B6F4|nr:hypothetical protein [Xanthomonas indica]MCI2243233.1 hypothetical protein [Xanthomonas indica]
MTERPILFNGPMVRAILDGRKTQTRRLLKSQHEGAFAALGQRKCHLGQPGDRLWVRETWGIALCGSRVSLAAEAWPDGWPLDRLRYAADGVPLGSAVARPSIHMPRWACRLVLEITDVRVARLQAISAADAEAEGLRKFPFEDSHAWAWRDGDKHGHASPTGAFRSLWESTGGDWSANPWVWAISFKRLEDVGHD